MPDLISPVPERERDTHDDNWGNHMKGCDPEFLKCLKHLQEIEFFHNINRNATFWANRNENCLCHSMI